MVKLCAVVNFFKLNAHDRHYVPLVERKNFYKKLKCKI